MIAFLELLKKQHSDDDSLIAINRIEKELTSKKYGLVWEEHQEEVDKKMETHIPVFSEIPEYELIEDEYNTSFNFLLEGDNLHSLKLLEKTHKGKVDVIYIDPPYNTEIFYPGSSKELWEERQKGNHRRADWAWRWSKKLFQFGYDNGFVVIKRKKDGSARIYTKTYLNAKIGKDSNG